MNSKMQRWLEIFGWIWVVIFVFIGVLGAGLHVLDYYILIADRPAVANFLIEQIYGKEFFDHWKNFRAHQPSRMIHMVVGIVFVVLIPLQVIPAIRKTHPAMHRLSGKILLVMSLILVVTGCIFAFSYTYTGLPEQVPTAFFSVLYLWILFMGLRHIRAKNVAVHREWMIRAFAMMMGISATRVWFYIFLKTTDIPSNHFFSSIFWMGLGGNLVIAEVWINLTRAYESRTISVQRSQIA